MPWHAHQKTTNSMQYSIVCLWNTVCLLPVKEHGEWIDLMTLEHSFHGGEGRHLVCFGVVTCWIDGYSMFVHVAEQRYNIWLDNVLLKESRRLFAHNYLLILVLCLLCFCTTLFKPDIIMLFKWKILLLWTSDKWSLPDCALWSEQGVLNHKLYFFITHRAAFIML